VAPPGLPLAVALGLANSNDATVFLPLLAGLQVRGRRGRPRRASPGTPRKRRQPRRGRPYPFCRPTSRVVRGAAERFSAWLKGGFRRRAVRYERLLTTFTALVSLACFLIPWRLLR
jgi:hypothetical protein